MKIAHHILFTSFVMTVIVFAIGILVSYWLDFHRIEEINSLISEHQINSEAYLLEESVLSAQGGIACSVMEKRMALLNEEIIQVGKDLTSYGGKSIFKKNDFELLRREYFLLQIRFYLLTIGLNEQCGKTYIPILFFYEAGDMISERQGLILETISDSYPGEVVITAIDKDYDKEPLIPYLVEKYGITKAPSLVIDGALAYERLAYGGEVNGTIIRLKRVADPAARDADFSFIFHATGVDEAGYAAQIRDMLSENLSGLTRGDLLYVLGRIERNDTLICSSLEAYDSYVPVSEEEQALIYETYASVGCGRNRRAFLLEAAAIWESLGNSFRAEVDRKLATKDLLAFQIDIPELKSGVKGYHSKGLVLIGSSSFSIDRQDLILSQADRVSRDWLSYQFQESPFSDGLLTVFQESLTYEEKHLQREIGWHEGGRLREISEAGIPRKVAAGTMVVRVDGVWYAPDEKGVLRFEVPIDKVMYPTTRFLREDIAVIIDTHGINMLVEQAMRYGATVVVGCCDHPGKIAAAVYLAERGRKVVCFTDKYLPLILGYGGEILGSPPFQRNGNRITFGNRPLAIDIRDTIVVSDVDDVSVQSYYDTPARYFRELEKYANIRVHYFNFTAHNQTYDLIEKARDLNSTTIGVRVFSFDDYHAVKGWLDEDSERKAVLFHSYPYPYGYRLMNDFPFQTTFDDINPRII